MTSRDARARLRGLYAVTPGMQDTPRLAALVEECIAGGAALVQYRAKDAPAALALEQARRLASICRERGVLFIVNDSIDLAVAAGADGVHLGRDDADPARARLALRGAIVGVSCYDDPGRARAAARAGADYVAIGSMFASATKPAAASASVEALARARADSGLPVAAIGGITPENAEPVVAAGADMLAVISALFDASDVRRAAASFAAIFESSKARPDVRAQPRAL